MRKGDGQSLTFTDFLFQRSYHVSIALTETSLQVSENTDFFAGGCIYTGIMKKRLDIHQMFGVSFIIYICTHTDTYCTMWGTGRNLVVPLLVYPLM
jgi:hypothetical protein